MRSVIGLALPTTFGLLACGGVPDEPGEGFPEGEGGGAYDDEGMGIIPETRLDPVLAGTDYRSCNPEQRATLRTASILGRTIATSGAFRECIRDSMLNGDGPRNLKYTSFVGPYVACSSWDPWRSSDVETQVDKVQAMVTSPNPIEPTCEDLPDGYVGLAEYGSYLHGGAEEFRIDAPDLEAAYDGLTTGDRSYAWRVGFTPTSTRTVGIAAALWHEAAHTHGYRHQQDNLDCGDAEYHESVPAIIDACMMDVWMDSAFDCERTDCAWHAGRIALLDGYDSETCECVRDPSEHWDPRTEDPASPVLGTNDGGDLFGFSLATGDFNGDGFEDLVVSAPGESSNRGAVYAYYGTIFGLYPWKKLEQPFLSLGSGNHYGFSLAAGDFTGDGFDDLAVGIPETSTGGHVAVFTGSHRGLFADVLLDQTGGGANEPGDQFGYALTAGDFDRDGQDDLVVGVPNEKPGSAPRAGYAYLFRGQANGLPALTMWAGLRQANVDAERDGDRFGEAVAAGNIGSDSSSSVDVDLAVGMPGDGAGKVVYFTSVPSVSGSSWAPARVVSDPTLSTGAGFGKAISIGRYRSSWEALVAIAAPNAPWQSSDTTGIVGLFDLSGNRDVVLALPSGQQGWGFGGSLATGLIDDVDTHEELVLGIAGPLPENTVSVYAGDTPSGRRVAEVDQTGMGSNETFDYFGYSVAAADFDGDGRDDIAVGAPGEAPGPDPAFSGAVFTYLAGDDGAMSPLTAINQED